MRDAYSILVRKPGKRGLQERRRERGNDNISIGVKSMIVDLERIVLARIGLRAS